MRRRRGRARRRMRSTPSLPSARPCGARCHATLLFHDCPRSTTPPLRQSRDRGVSRLPRLRRLPRSLRLRLPRHLRLSRLRPRMDPSADRLRRQPFPTYSRLHCAIPGSRPGPTSPRPGSAASARAREQHGHAPGRRATARPGPALDGSAAGRSRRVLSSAARRPRESPGIAGVRPPRRSPGGTPWRAVGRRA